MLSAKLLENLQSLAIAFVKKWGGKIILSNGYGKLYTVRSKHLHNYSSFIDPSIFFVRRYQKYIWRVWCSLYKIRDKIQWKKSKTTWLIIASFDLLVHLKKYFKIIFSFDFQLFQFAAECF